LAVNGCIEGERPHGFVIIDPDRIFIVVLVAEGFPRDRVTLPFYQRGNRATSQVTALGAYEKRAPVVRMVGLLGQKETPDGLRGFPTSVFLAKDRDCVTEFAHKLPKRLSVDDEIEKVPLRFGATPGKLHSSTYERPKF